MNALSPSLTDRPFYGLWSLWDMIELKIKPFLDAQDVLVNCSALLHAGHGNRFPQGVDTKWRAGLIGQFLPLMEQLRGDEFALCRRAAERLIETLRTNDDPTQIVGHVDDLRRRLLDQAEAMESLWLSPTERDRYAPRAPLFGAAFETKYVSGGIFELDEAAKCLALGRSTAAVFHLMRLMEIAVRSVARCLQIPDPIQPAQRNWGAVLKSVRDAIDAKWSTTPARTNGDGEFFDALYASLDAVKNPWRNSTMHPANKYTTEEAEHIYAAVRGFVMKLADRCDENGDPQA
jgi:hypothetical protein